MFFLPYFQRETLFFLSPATSVTTHRLLRYHILLKSSVFFCFLLDDKTLLKEGQLVKERICSWRSKFLSFRVDLNKKGGKNENGKVDSFERIHIPIDCMK